MQNDLLDKEKIEKDEKKRQNQKKRKEFLKLYKNYIVVLSCFLAIVLLVVIFIIYSIASSPTRYTKKIDGITYVKYYNNKTSLWLSETTNDAYIGEDEKVTYTKEDKEWIKLYKDDTIYQIYDIGRLYDIEPVAYSTYSEELGTNFETGTRYNAIDDGGSVHTGTKIIKDDYGDEIRKEEYQYTADLVINITSNRPQKNPSQTTSAVTKNTKILKEQANTSTDPSTTESTSQSISYDLDIAYVYEVEDATADYRKSIGEKMEYYYNVINAKSNNYIVLYDKTTLKLVNVYTYFDTTSIFNLVKFE